MVANDLGDQRQAEPRTIGLGGDERVEQERQDIGRHAGPIVLDDDFERQRDALGHSGHADANTRTEGRRQLDLRFLCPFKGF
ncbi:hypothetical protein D3C87_1755730 [compost metagenome]